MSDRLGQNAIQVLASGGIRQLSPQTSGGGGGTGIKWHPGHYGASLIRTGASNSQLSTKQQEIATVLSTPYLLGWMGRYQWPAFQNTNSSTTYDFSVLDTDYNQLTYNADGTRTGKRMWIQVVVDSFNATPSTVVPPFIYNNPSTYGTGINGPAGTGGYVKYSSIGVVAALWRSSVNGAMNALLTKLAQHVLRSGNTVDTDPYIEGIMLWEVAAVVSAAVSGSDWSSSSMETQIYSTLDTMVAQFPTTNKILENNYASDGAQTVRIHQALQSKGCGFGGPDIWGKSLIDGTGTPHGTINNLSWGQQVFSGATTNTFPAGNQDMRGLMPCAHEIEDAEMASYGTWGPYTPQDLMNCVITYLSKTNNAGGVSYLLWDIIPGNSPAVTDPTTLLNVGTTPGNIGSVITMAAANPIPFTGKPANYAAINTT